tara:strand:- start:82708 stop:83442 length:735 start_codon:yes stop_codon:yes gene_type:complete
MTLHEFRTTLYKARNTQELEAMLTAFLKTFGIHAFSFTYYAYHPNSANKLKYDYASSCYRSWHEYYQSSCYDEIDSTLAESYNRTLPIYWEVEAQLEKAKTEREKQMREESVKVGVTKGVSFPVHGPKEDFALFLVAERKDENCLKNWKDLQYELMSAAYIYYTYLQRYILKSAPEDTKYHLSSREIECLTLLAKDESVAQIAATMSITDRTVNFHIQNINKKLGVKNKHQAVKKAIDKKLLTL